MSLWSRFKAFLIRRSNVYPPKWWWPVVRIFGGPLGQKGPCYMTRVNLTPPLRHSMQLWLHIFHREDMDRDPHDHPFPFWTMPINQSYIEEVFDPNTHCFKRVTVKRWRIHKREATHCHRIVETASGRWPLITIVFRGPSIRKWGFWCYVTRAARTHIYWRNYVYIEGSPDGTGGAVVEAVANRDGDRDEWCPGFNPNYCGGMAKADYISPGRAWRG